MEFGSCIVILNFQINHRFIILFQEHRPSHQNYVHLIYVLDLGDHDLDSIAIPRNYPRLSNLRQVDSPHCQAQDCLHH